jgi:hypothetical protein
MSVSIACLPRAFNISLKSFTSYYSAIERYLKRVAGMRGRIQRHCMEGDWDGVLAMRAGV